MEPEDLQYLQWYHNLTVVDEFLSEYKAFKDQNDIAGQQIKRKKSLAEERLKTLAPQLNLSSNLSPSQRRRKRFQTTLFIQSRR